MSTQFHLHGNRYRFHGAPERIVGAKVRDCRRGSITSSRDQEEETDPITARLQALEDSIRSVLERLNSLESNGNNDQEFLPEVRKAGEPLRKVGEWLAPKLQGEDRRRRKGRDQASVKKLGEGDYEVRCSEHGLIGNYSDPDSAAGDMRAHNWLHAGSAVHASDGRANSMWNRVNAAFWKARM